MNALDLMPENSILVLASGTGGYRIITKQCLGKLIIKWRIDGSEGESITCVLQLYVTRL